MEKFEHLSTNLYEIAFGFTELTENFKDPAILMQLAKKRITAEEVTNIFSAIAPILKKLEE